MITAESFDDKALVEFLKQQGVYNLGMWVRETPLSMYNSVLDIPGYGELDTDLDPYVLPIEG